MSHYYSQNHHDECMCGTCQTTFRRANPNAFTNPHYTGGMVECSCKGCQDRYKAGVKGMARSEIALTIGEERGMSTLNMCEREGCDALIKGRALGGVTLIYTTDQQSAMSRNGDNVRKLELCPACVEDIHNVISIAPLTPRVQGYSKPFDPTERDVADDLSNVDTEHLAAVLLERTMKTAKAVTRNGESA